MKTTALEVVRDPIPIPDIVAVWTLRAAIISGIVALIALAAESAGIL